MTTDTTETINGDMASKLKAAGEKAKAERQERRERTVKGSHLLEPMREYVTAEGCSILEQTAALKVSGGVKKKLVYIAKKGGVVSISGFTLQHPAVKQITEADARARHLGLVRGQLDFDKSDDEVMAAFKLAVAEIKNPEVRDEHEAEKSAEAAAA